MGGQLVPCQCKHTAGAANIFFPLVLIERGLGGANICSGCASKQQGCGHPNPAASSQGESPALWHTRPWDAKHMKSLWSSCFWGDQKVVGIGNSCPSPLAAVGSGAALSEAMAACAGSDQGSGMPVTAISCIGTSGHNVVLPALLGPACVGRPPCYLSTHPERLSSSPWICPSGQVRCGLPLLP